MSMRGLRFGPAAFTVLVLLGCRMLFAAQPADLASARQQFLQAMAQAQQPAHGPEAGPTDATDDPALRSYPLYPYLQAERIHQAFGDGSEVVAADRRAAGFLATYGLLPVGIQLRRSWLESLAQRSQWDAFLTIYREAAASDALRCQAFTARIATAQTAQLGPSLVRQWLTMREVPECDDAYAWGVDHGMITSDLIERRARLALQAGNTAIAKPLIARLPATQALPLRQWAQLLDTPRLARQDPDAAVDRYAQLVRTRNLTSESASAFALAVALPLAWRRDAHAEDYFARVSTHELDDNVLEWRARAAMWAGNWSLVTQSIAAMSETNRQSARWRYWSARTLEQAGDSAQARVLFAALAPDDNYYSGLAAARLGINVTPHPQPLSRDEPVRARLAQMPALVRAD